MVSPLDFLFERAVGTEVDHEVVAECGLHPFMQVHQVGVFGFRPELHLFLNVEGILLIFYHLDGSQHFARLFNFHLVDFYVVFVVKSLQIVILFVKFVLIDFASLRLIHLF